MLMKLQEAASLCKKCVQFFLQVFATLLFHFIAAFMLLPTF